MPGCSLWLVPPKDSPIYDKLATLICKTLPAQFPEATPERLVAAGFVPHVTLTSDVPLDLFTRAQDVDEARCKADAQAWLDSIRVSLPRGSEVDVRFRGLDVGNKFVQKLTLRVERQGVRDLALWSRVLAVEDGLNTPAQRWADEAYWPHCSLIYSGSIDISEEKKAQLQKLVEAAGISIDGSGDLGGWKGGTVWLVPTYKPIPEWTPWAEVLI
ncbi:2',3'-cyclic-nucleotide 3'-phosphodiesterase [Phyllosticta citriasiana]|uniref:2',3'-cyclic-nucleotide 3'-phosphodiesterase n=1 Tax=Phyllosticta citriasiana TaxID=595635 RepID=A0ABR1KE25_9PEZI